MKTIDLIALAALCGLLMSACDTGADSPPITGAQCGDTEIEFIQFETQERWFVIAETPNGAAPALPVDAIEKPVPIDGESIFAFEIPGQDPPILLMHGLPDNTYLYDRLYPQLSGRRVVAFDFIGWGRSSKPLPGAYEYSFAQQQREIAAVIDSFGLDQVIMVAHDSSGPPAIDFIRATPERIQRLVLLNTFYGRAQGALIPPKAVELHVDARLEEAEIAVQKDPCAIESYYRFQMDEFIVSAPDEQEFIDNLWALYGEARPAFVALTNRLTLEVGPRTLVEDQNLSELLLPVDIVFGTEDPYLNPRVAQHFASHIPQARLTLIEQAGHFVQVDAPAMVAEIILGP